MKYTIEDIAVIIKGEFLSKPSEGIIEHLLLDSRKLIFPSASLFFSLTGPRRNGHLFIKELYGKGVINFVVSEAINVNDYPDANIIIVKDAMQALQQLVAHHRKQFGIPVIGITGSNGKTIVKEWLNQLLEERYNIVRSPKSYNSQIGVPLSVWQMNNSHQLGIFEAGISESDEMHKIEKIIQPTIGVFTNIGEAHSEGFLNIRQKVNEKLQLFKNVDTLIYSKDYPAINEGIASYIKQLRDGTTASRINFFSWSAKIDATLRVTSVVKELNHTSIAALYNQKEIDIRIPFTDDASIENSITCWCTLLYLQVEQEYIRQRFETLSPVAMRLELKKGINNCSIINDSYSADLSSLKIALDFLSHQQQHSKKTIILSDILQSGKNDRDLYLEIANSLNQKNISRFFGIGPQISKHYQSFENVTGMKSFFYPDMDSFLKEFPLLSFTNETILLKGARIFEFERIGHLLEQKIHQTVLEIDQNALLHNLSEYQGLLKPTTRIMAMVKAFSYGSGSFEIANLLQFHKVDYLAVAYADEGIELRKSGITLPIMIMNAEESTFEALCQYQLEPDLYSFNILNDFDVFLKKKNIEGFPVHIELETGMNRLGFDLQQLPLLIESLKNSYFKIQSVFSHLVASEDAVHDEYTQTQCRNFLGACNEIQRATGYSFIRHINNSAGISRHPDLQLDMVRLGIGLYGIDSGNSGLLDLIEVSSLKTTIAQVKYVKKGETVGYGRKGLLLRDSVIATVRLGYADGYPRRLGNGNGKMLVNGHQAPVVGSICMDMTMIDITGIPGVQEGDDVIVFGKDLSVTLLAQWAETIPYEIMTGISQRVKRVYYE
ncbi:MAG: bifunctional UDP-N-acetylmuramoyl-tripeptide:D-alanyl-D-alanine ligase/alanine racemase, partial [Ginsengibacter sp.]